MNEEEDFQGERVWEEKTQDMEESCTFWGAMSHSVTGKLEARLQGRAQKP